MKIVQRKWPLVLTYAIKLNYIFKRGRVCERFLEHTHTLATFSVAIPVARNMKLFEFTYPRVKENGSRHFNAIITRVKVSSVTHVPPTIDHATTTIQTIFSDPLWI